MAERTTSCAGAPHGVPNVALAWWRCRSTALQTGRVKKKISLRSKSADLAMYLVGKSSKNAADRYPGISVWLSRSPGISV